jgi:hypothetical protein
MSHVTVSGVWERKGKGVTCNGFWGLEGEGTVITCNGFWGLEGEWEKVSHVTVLGVR